MEPLLTAIPTPAQTRILIQAGLLSSHSVGKDKKGRAHPPVLMWPPKDAETFNRAVKMRGLLGCTLTWT